MAIASINHSPSEMQPTGKSAGIDVKNNEAINRLNQVVVELTRQLNEIGIPKNTLERSGIDPAFPPPELPDDLEEIIESARSAFGAIDNDQARADLFAILELLLRVAQSQRKDQHEVRFAGYQKQERLQNAVAAKARQAADDRMWGAIASGIGQAVGGMVMIGTGTASIGSVWNGTTSQAWNSIGQGASSVVGALGGATESGFQAAAAERDAQKVELEAAGRKQEQATQVVNEQMQQLMDSIRNLFDKLQSVEQLRQDVNRGISQRL